MANVIWNTADFFSKMGNLDRKATKGAKNAIQAVAEDLLAKSQNEVPLDQAILQNSGHTEHKKDESAVVYGGASAPYAIYQHEGARKDGSHVIRNHSISGRKTKFLEDPIKNNMAHWLKVYGQVFAGTII